MKKIIYIFLTFLVFIASVYAAPKEIVHPLTYDIDIFDFYNNLVLSRIDNTNLFSYDLKKIKVKKEIIQGDTLRIKFLVKTGIPLDYLKCTIVNGNGSVLGSQYVTNPREDNIFSAAVDFIVDEAVVSPLSINFICKNNTDKKNIKLLIKEFDQTVLDKTNLLPQKELAAEFLIDSVTTTDSFESKNNEQKENESDNSAKRNELPPKPENTIEISSLDDDSAAKATQAKSSDNDGSKEDKTAAKSKKAKKGDLPENIQNIIDKTEETTSSWYICKTKGKQKAGAVISGPFETKEEALSVWIFKALVSKKKSCIAKNLSFVTDSPDTYFSREYQEINNYFTENGGEQTLEYYFITLKQLAALEASKEEAKQAEISEENKVEENSQNENQENVGEQNKEKPEEVYSAPFFEIPSRSDTSKTQKYDREYLQDYAPKKKPVLPKDNVQEVRIDDPNERDSFGRTLLMNAAKSGNNWLIKSLLSSGAEVNVVDDDGWSALMYAVRYQENNSVIDTLINAGAKIKIKNKYNLSPLSLAAAYNSNPEIIKRILSFYSVSEKEVLQAFVLLLTENNASDFSKIAIIDSFLEKSVPLNTFYNGKTPLMYAASYGNSTKILQILLEAGSITSIRSTEDKTAFDYAMENKNLAHDDYFWALNK